MSVISAILKGEAKKLVKKYRERQLNPGEKGWGKPPIYKPAVKGVGNDKNLRVAIIGMGAQGVAQGQGYKSIPGITLVGIADTNSDRLKSALQSLGLPLEIGFTDAQEMLQKLGPLDLVSIATTAPFHVSLGRLALAAGAKRIMLEKPIDTSLVKSLEFKEECKAAGVVLSVNYSRRFLPDTGALKRFIDKGYIGTPRSISIEVGKGELAMIASHYFDLCRFILDDETIAVSSILEPVIETNRRGGDYIDPYGYAHFTFSKGGKAYLDFSSTLGPKSAQILIKGDAGYILVDESTLEYTIVPVAGLPLRVQFSEPMKASSMFARAASSVLNEDEAKCSVDDGISALHMILGSHLSSSRGGALVQLPLEVQEAEGIGVQFP